MYGLNSKLINWIEDFLCFRTQRIKVNGVFSTSKPVLSGISQGSVLGPVLFIIYINDLPDVCKQFSSIFLFADDAMHGTMLHGTIVDDSDSNMLRHSCQLLSDWSDE